MPTPATSLDEINAEPSTESQRPSDAARPRNVERGDSGEFPCDANAPLSK
jgi:hypothetical protein